MQRIHKLLKKAFSPREKWMARDVPYAVPGTYMMSGAIGFIAQEITTKESK